MYRIYDFMSDDVRGALNDEKLDTVVGGFINDGGCIPHQPLTPVAPPTPWTFKDPFAKWTIGR
jgi:hypothetical protein